jgi:Zn-dependent protease with chaperone function
VQPFQAIKKDLFRVARNAVLALFLVPGLTLLFTHHAQKTWDTEFVDGIHAQAQAHRAELTPHDTAVIRMIEETPPSAACDSGRPEHAEYRADVCKPYGDTWQFHWMDKAAAVTLLGGLGALLLIAVLGRMAFGDRDAQYRSMVLAWRLLAIASALFVVLQSVMAVWMSFWVTAFFVHKYFVKLIIMIGIGGAIAASVAVKQIFAKIPTGMDIPGEPIAEADAPALWSRIRALAAQLGTEPPRNIVAGIDANFFVTETGVTAGGHALTGRTLYVSLPLLRVLDQREADAVLAHELAHFKGGDTSMGAALGPKIAQFDTYRASMHGAGLTVVAYCLLTLYRTVFELALMRDSREREFIADREAARCVHGLPLVRALIKVAAYSGYRDRIERELFDREHRHEGAIGIASHVANGLQPFARSEEFLALMKDVSVPHPFDSHPQLQERMDNVKCTIPHAEYGQVLGDQVGQTWSSEILTGDEIEARLWSAYESGFAQAHEETLAYRYLPEDDAQREIVLKYFPPLVVPLKDAMLEIRYDGLTLPDGTVVDWHDITDLKYEDAYLGDVLTLTLDEKGLIGAKKNKVKLPGAKPHRDMLKSALGQYWHRHRVAYNQA